MAPNRNRRVRTPDRAGGARELLVFYPAGGVAALVGKPPADRLAIARTDAPALDDAAPMPPRQSAGRLQPSPLESAPLAAAAVAPAPDIAVMAAREAARSAASLDELRAMLAKFEGCALRTTAKQLVFADGNS